MLFQFTFLRSSTVILRRKLPYRLPQPRRFHGFSNIFPAWQLCRKDPFIPSHTWEQNSLLLYHLKAVPLPHDFPPKWKFSTQSWFIMESDNKCDQGPSLPENKVTKRQLFIKYVSQRPLFLYQCLKCEELFTDVKLVRNHLKLHNQRNRLRPCTYCPLQLPSSLHYYRHIKIAHQDKLKTSKSITAQHVQPDHSGNAAPELLRLQKNTSQPNNLEVQTDLSDNSGQDLPSRNESENSNVLDYICNICAISFKRLSILKNHLQVVHELEQDQAVELANQLKHPEKEPNLIRELSASTSCSNDESSPAKKIRQSFTSLPPKCALCARIFYHRLGLIKHYRAKHAEVVDLCEEILSTFTPSSQSQTGNKIGMN